MIKEVESDEEIMGCFDVMAELRPDLVRDDFLALFKELQKDGLRISFLEDNDKVCAVAGYHITSNFHMGRYMYIDDLCTTATARSKGYGEQMLNWLKSEARNEKCNVFTLDSGTFRKRAHKFYFQQGLTIECFHFTEELD
ncbi:MAG: GNAT family N-acetyltransferase [Kiritimatiellae bacterium]|jgi:GNAT superfamily N-acetyltransferase|nr:GNAT family N-acetyltransferase [Kiritimatiellia bacterium]